jgi:hypothetical protein
MFSKSQFVQQVMGQVNTFLNAVPPDKRYEFLDAAADALLDLQEEYKDESDDEEEEDDPGENRTFLDE